MTENIMKRCFEEIPTTISAARRRLAGPIGLTIQNEPASRWRL